MMFQCQLMIDPVMAADGFTYEREAIELWLKGHDTPHQSAAGEQDGDAQHDGAAADCSLVRASARHPQAYRQATGRGRRRCSRSHAPAAEAR